MIHTHSFRAYTRIIKIASLLLCIVSMAVQKSFSQKALSIGDTVPDVQLTMLNFPKKTIKLSEFNGKAIILDFWATWCAPCVASFPKMDSLKTKYSDKLQIVPVTYQDAKPINLLFDKMDQNSGFKIKKPYTAIKDQSLAQLFPFNSLPHYVWIDKNRIVRAITDLENVNENNIELFLSDKPFYLPQKTDPIITVDCLKPVFFRDKQINLRPDEILYRNERDYESVLTGYRQEIMATGLFDSNRILSANSIIKQLYQDAFGERKPDFLNDNRILYDVKDSSMLLYRGDKNDRDSFGRWFYENSYCYEIIVPVVFDSLSKLSLSYMQRDLNRYFAKFGICGKREIVHRKCLVLRKSVVFKEEALLSHGGKPEVIKNAYYYKLTNKTLKSLDGDLNSYYWQLRPLPIVNETGITQPVDLVINAKMDSVEDVIRELAKYGLDVAEEYRDMDMIVITQR